VSLLGRLLLAVLAFVAGCDSGGDYHRNDGRWHFDKLPLEVADAASFQPLGRHFARDKLRGYYLGVAVADSDGASFEALSEHEARDSRRVYWAETYRKGQEYWSIQHQRVFVLNAADPARYRSLGHGYGGDGRSVFFEGVAFKVRDAATFAVLDAQFTRDAQRGYFERTEVADSDGASFELVDPRESSYARDRRHVWYATMVPQTPAGTGPPLPVVRLLRGAAAATVQLPGRGYARDGARVWWQGLPVAGVDAASFKVNDDHTQEHDAQDARGAYRQGRRVSAGATAASSSSSGTGR